MKNNQKLNIIYMTVSCSYKYHYIILSLQLYRFQHVLQSLHEPSIYTQFPLQFGVVLLFLPASSHAKINILLRINK